LTIPPTAAGILQATAAEYELTLDKLLQPGRERSRVAARREAMRRLYACKTPSGAAVYPMRLIAGWFEASTMAVALAIREGGVDVG
jgi:hypothetical protein